MISFQAIAARVKTQPPAPAIQDKAEISRLFRYWRIRVLYSTVGGYAVFYFVRSNLPMAAKAIMDQYHITNTRWGLALGLSTIVYGFSKFFSGVIGDQTNPRYVLPTALFLSAIVNVFFGFGTGLGFFAAAWTINSLFQGVGVPPCTRLLTHWFSPRKIGRAWGFWNASHQIGGGIIAVAAGYLVVHFGWRSAFWAPAAVAIITSFWLYHRLTDSPESMGLPPVEVFEGESPHPASAAGEPFWPIFKRHILTNRWVWVVSAANFFVYVVRIGVYTWAPKYLLEAKGFSLGQAGWSLFAFEFSGIFGALSAGWLSDTVFRGRRGPVSVTYMLCLFVFLLILFNVPSGNFPAMVAVFTALGFFVYGPQMLVAVAAADFATKVASATAVGLTGFFGYVLGATACNVVTGMLVDRFGWNSAVLFYAASAIAGCALLATTWNKTSPLISNRA